MPSRPQHARKTLTSTEHKEEQVARSRGFFAELNHQARLADQRREALVRQEAAAQRKVDQAHRAAERARAAASRAYTADRARLEREAAQAYAADRLEEANEMNSELVATYAKIDGILSATLGIDDFVDLQTLRVSVTHPPFGHPELSVPTPTPKPFREPPAPLRRQPAATSGLFGRKKREAQASAEVDQQYAAEYQVWQAEMQSLPERRANQARQFEDTERERVQKLEQEMAIYRDECKQRTEKAEAQNAALDELINGLAYGVVEAVQEYVSIVTDRSVYPEVLPVAHSSTFDPSAAELTMRVSIPGPETIPSIRAYRYNRASDEISSTSATQKETRERYAGIVNNVALRTLHEIFEADRRTLIQSIGLEVGTEAVSTATGRVGYVPLLVVATTREIFEAIDLAAIVPTATLEYLKATVSKNPAALVPVVPKGVRKA